MAEKTYLEFTEAGGSQKFYEVTLDGAVVTTRYGKIGAKGRTQSKTHPSEAKASAEAQKKLNEKRRKGYAEKGGAAAAPAPAPAPAPARRATRSSSRSRANTARPASNSSSSGPLKAPTLWTFATSAQAFGVYVDDEQCWVGNEQGEVFCLDHAGKVLQQFKLPNGVKCLVADEAWRYAGCNDGKVYDISGKLPYIAYEVSRDVDLYWLDIFDGVLGVSDAKGNVTVINHEEESQWSTKSPGSFGWMVRCDEIGVYHGYKSGVTMYDWEDGSVIWRHDLQGAVLFGWQDEGSVYAAASNRMIYRISKSGELGQTYACDGMVFACSTTPDGELIFASDNSANLYCFKANGERLWKLKTGCGSAYSMQHHDDRLYIVTTRGTLACIDVSEGAIQTSREGRVPIPREFEAPASSQAEARIDHVERVAASSVTASGTGVIVRCLKEGGKIRVRPVSEGYNKDWNVQFPRGLREVGARFIVGGLREANRGGFYRITGDIKRLED